MPPSRKPRRPRIGGRPDQVADALEAEHRVVDEERDRVDAVVGVGGAGGDERRQRARLGDPLFEDLPVLRLLVVEQGVHVDRLVLLADVRVDADLRGTATPCRRCAPRPGRSARPARRSPCRAAASTAAARTPSWSTPCGRRCPCRTPRTARCAGGSIGSTVSLRAGTKPPSALRRSRRYCSSMLSSGGR